jgi:sodium/bile acid cotransporter 7
VSPVLLLVVNIVLLTSVMVTTAFASRRLGFSPRGRDRDRVLRFQEQPGQRCSDGHRAAPAATVGLTVLPLMLFHQIQLTVCASLARRYAARPVTPQPAELVRLVGVGISDRVVRGGHAKALQAMPSWERRLTTRRVVRELGCTPADQSLSGMYSPFS